LSDQDNEHPPDSHNVELIRDVELIRAQVKKRVEDEKNNRKKEEKEVDHGDLPSSFVHACLRTNSHGDGELFKALHGNDFVYCTSMGEWLHWAGHHWEIDHIVAALAAVEDVADAYERGSALKLKQKLGEASKEEAKAISGLINKLERRAEQLRATARREACLLFARTSKDPLAIEGAELDCKPWLLACPNGVMELKTGRFRPGRPEDYLLKACPTEWKGFDAPWDEWEKALLDIFNGDKQMVDFMQRLFGLALVGEQVENIFISLIGLGRNGKSKITETICFVMGDLARVLSPEILLSQRSRNSAGPSPDIMQLKGIRFAFCSETDEGAKFSASRVKRLSGSGILSGRNPHDKYEQTFNASHTLFLDSNEKPQAPGADFAFWARMVVVPFEVCFVSSPNKPNERQKDPLLFERILAKEASGILAWLVEGCLIWQKWGLCPPAKVTAAVQEYHDDEDLLGQFINECCVVGDGLSCNSTELYDAFATWYSKNVSKKYIPKHKKFGQWMKRRFERRKPNRVVYYGIGLRADI